MSQVVRAPFRRGIVLAALLVLLPLRAAPVREAGEERRGDDPAGARRLFLEKRSPDGVSPIPLDWYLKARDKMSLMPGYSTRLGRGLPSRRALASGRQPLNGLGTWNSLGPGNVGGLVEALVVNPVSPAIMYAAGASGGVWKTTNAGTSWAPLTDFLPNINVNALAMDPKNPNVLYAGTGESIGSPIFGGGIFKTTDAGATWSQIATYASPLFFVSKIAVSPLNSNRIYFAALDGIYRTLDAGASLSRVYASTTAGGIMDLVVPTGQPADVVVASDGNFTQASIVRNSDAGGSGTWTAAYTEANMGRTSLAFAPSSPNVVYAMASSNEAGSLNGNLLAVLRSIDGGAIWSVQVRNTDPLPLNTYLLGYALNLCLVQPRGAGQGWYDNVIAVDPVDPNRVWAGGIDLYRSDDGGANWALASYWWLTQNTLPHAPQYAHADQHAIVFHPGYNGTANQTMFVGNDGGLMKTDNARGTTSTDSCASTPGSVSWTTLNNDFGVTEFYMGLPYPNGQTYFGGTQDNGTVRGTDAGGPNAWETLRSGDGGWVAVDPTNTNVLFQENVYLDLRKSVNGGTTFVPATSGITESPIQFSFITPFVMDPGNPQRLWIGGRIPWRTVDQGATWTQAGAAFTAGNFPVTAIAVAPADANYVLMGRRSGFVTRTVTALSNTAGTVWASSLPTPTQAYISSLAFDPLNKNVAYATYSTFGVPHVWKSIDAGATWASIDGTGVTGIPDIPVHVLVVDPANTSRLYVGTDLGVLTSLDGGVHWAVENTGFANVITESLSFASGKLFAFTYGRGAWRVPLVPAGPLAVACPAAAAQSGVAYASAFTATGGSETYIYSIASGALPGGLGLNAATGAVTGTPGAAGVFPFVARVTDSLGGAATSSCTITVSAPVPPDLVVAKSHAGNFVQGQKGATYTLTVSNVGGSATSGTVTVTEALPAGLAATGIAGTGWICTQPAGPCNRSDALAATASYPALTLTVNVATTAPPSVVNVASVAGGGETNTANDSASDPTTIGGSLFFTLTPCRILDTRNANGALGGPVLAPGQQRIFTVTGACGIPSDAAVLSVNVTMTGSTASGTIQLFAGDAPAPGASVLSFAPGNTRADAAVVAMSSDGAGTIAIRNTSAGTVHVILDVNAFFR